MSLALKRFLKASIVFIVTLEVDYWLLQSFFQLPYTNSLQINSCNWFLITFPSGDIQSVNIWPSVQPTIHRKPLPNTLIKFFELLFSHSVLLATFLKVGTTHVLMVFNTFLISTVNFINSFNLWMLDSHYQKNLRYFLYWNPFRNDKKVFHFIFKALSVISQDISVFATNFWSCRKSSLIRKTGLILKFMTSQPG